MLLAGLGRYGRFRNRHKLLVIMYHGVTRKRHEDPIWTQLPLHLFEAQIDFLHRYYHPVTLGQVLRSLHGRERLPERAVLLTFDDGLKNNYSVAWPILRAKKIPAVIFLTVDFIGGSAMLWPDELYLLIKGAWEQGVPVPNPLATCCSQAGTVWQRYVLLIETMKRMKEGQRLEAMALLSRELPLPASDFAEEFALLNWEEVTTMHHHGLIDYGVHTATHKILSRLSPVELKNEIVSPKKKLEEKLGHEIQAFCYPNGRSNIDFTNHHKELLRREGYVCAFATDHGLHTMNDDPFAIRRIAAGNDMTSYPALFELASAGII